MITETHALKCIKTSYSDGQDMVLFLAKEIIKSPNIENLSGREALEILIRQF